jgi:hypothetical protein
MGSRKGSEDVGERARVVTCACCGCLSGPRWAGWRGYRTDDPELNEPPALAFFCPACAEREFDAPSGRRSA